MRKILIATRGEFAGGLKQTMGFALGGNEKVGVLGACTTPDFDMGKETAIVADELGDGGELIIMVDMLGDSATNAFSGHISRPGAYILVGVNTPMLLAMVPMLESAMDTQELITRGIQAAREECVLINGLMRRAFGKNEEDLV